MRTPIHSSHLSTKAPAALTAGVLAMSAVMPPIALAEQDTNDDGTAAVTQTNGGDDQGTSFDPGGSSQLPDTPAAPVAPPVAAPTAQAPPDENDPVVDAGDGSSPAGPPSPKSADPNGAATTAPTPDAPPPPPDQPAAPAAAPATDQAAPTPVVETAPPVVAAPAVAAPRPTPQARIRVKTKNHRSIHRVIRAAPTAPVVPATQVAVPVSAPAPTQSVAVPAALRAHLGDRTHTVRRGESLWVIASDLLGANGGERDVAREVHRLWMRNVDRIGTGNPSVLLIGTKLILK